MIKAILAIMAIVSLTVMAENFEYKDRFVRCEI